MPDKNELRQVIETWIHDKYEPNSDDDYQSVRMVALIGAEKIIDDADRWGIGADNA